MDNLREALKQRTEKSCAVMLDTKGPEVRTGYNQGNKHIDVVVEKLQRKTVRH